MKIKKSQLRKIILESLLVEAISVAQAEEKFKKEKMKAWKSMIFVMKRDGVDAIKAAAGKYDYSKNQQSEWDRDDPFETRYNDGIPYGVEHTTEEEIFTNTNSFVPIDVLDADRSNSILWLIKQFKSDLGLFFALTEEEVLIDANGGNQAEANLTNKIRNSLEKFGQFKHLINPPEKRDLFRIANMQELFSIVAAHDAVIDAENKRLGDRVDTQNVLNGFKSLTGKISAAKENNALILVKNPQTGFYTIPDENGFVVGEIHSKAASVKLGSGTDWCTAAPGLDFFNHYYQPNDPLYYIEDNGKRYQFSYGEGQFMDTKDEPISDKLVQKYTQILKNLLIRRDGSIQNENIENYLLVLKAKDPNTTPEELDKLSNNKNENVKHSVASNTSTPPETLIKLSNDKNENVRYSVAMNSSTPPEILVKLASDENYMFRELVTRNQSTPLETLIKLSDDEHNHVRISVATNSSTPPEILVKLASDEHYYVRKAVASNTSTSPETLVKLSDDDHNDVKHSVATNSSTPPEVLVKLSNDENYYVRKAVATNSSTPPEVLVKLSDDENNNVRYSVAMNSSTPPEVLVKLSNDKNKNIRKAVASNPTFRDYEIGQSQNINERWMKIAGLLN